MSGRRSGHDTRSAFDRKVSADATRLRVTAGRLSAARSSPSSGRTGGKSREIVVRVLNKGKHHRAPMAQARYIARVNSPEHRADRDRETSTVLETHDGRQLTTRGEIDAEMASWGLKTENRSKSWEAADPEARAAMDKAWHTATPEWRKENPGADPYDRVQSVHIIVSVPNGTADQLREAVRRSAEKSFAGHRFVFAIHTDHGRGPHAHFVVQNDHMDTGRPLRLKKMDLEALRQDFAATARDTGIDVVASRRVDRMAPEIAQGLEPFHKHDRSRGRWTPGDTFAAKAPRWHAAYGQDFAARVAGIEEEPTQPRKGYFARFVNKEPSEMRIPEFAATARNFGHYADSVGATRSYLAMFREDPRLAQWAFTKRPDAFGTVGDHPAPRKAPDGTAATKAAWALADDKLYPSPAGGPQRVAEIDQAASAQRRRNGAASVARSNDALSRNAAAGGDQVAAAEAATRAAAARAHHPIPGFSQRSNGKQTKEGMDMGQRSDRKTPEQMIASYAAHVAEVERIKAEVVTNGPSAELTKKLQRAQMLRRKAGEQIVKDPKALGLAREAGMAQHLLQYQQGMKLGIGL